ncbi:hypothetical protein [Sinorhizobium fredii]|uniref:hypothetical protein n=1 Tax=Rhizobium fredii TaxID=380 RepID=UPI0039773F3E
MGEPNSPKAQADKLISTKLSASDNVAGVIDSMELKDVLSQIEADDSDLLKSHEAVPSLSCAW